MLAAFATQMVQEHGQPPVSVNEVISDPKHGGEDKAQVAPFPLRLLNINDRMVLT